MIKKQKKKYAPFMTCLERNIQLSLIKTVSITSTDSVIVRTTEKQVYLRFIGLLHLTKFLIGHFLNSLFLSKCLLHCNDLFGLHMCSLNGKSLVVFLKSCLSIHSFLVKNAKICFFEEKWF